MRFANILLSAAMAHAVTFTVECNGNTDYIIDGEQDPVLTVSENDVVTFAIGLGCSSHPFQLQNANDEPIEPTLTGSTDNVIWTVPGGAATYKYVCTAHTAMTGTITVTGPIADAPTDFSASAESTTSAALSWTTGQQSNGCIWKSWDVKAINSANNASTVAQGCNQLTEGETSCFANGLIDGASYWFSVQMVCQESTLNSATVTTAKAISLAPASPVASVVATATSATTATLVWTQVTSFGGCVFEGYVVKTSEEADVEGCPISLNSTNCTATSLSPGTAYSFTVNAICTKLAFKSSLTTSNSITTWPAVVVNVTCEGITAFKINGVANANVTVTQGDLLIFSIGASCASSPLEIETIDGNAYTSGVTATANSVQIGTSALTPATLRYVSNEPDQTSMGGWIIVKPPPTKADRPTISASSHTDTATVALNWSAGNAGDCVFSNWLVKTEGGDSVEGCITFPNASVTNCIATGLAGATDYRFTVQRVCTNSLANSEVSAPSTRVTTISTVGIVVCQGGGTCNCGNATICTCQLTDVCNCDFADKCVCQGGKCNGGNANLMICQSTDCNKQCAKSCPTCFSDAFSGLFGSKSCVSSSIAVSASGVLLAVLSLFAF